MIAIEEDEMEREMSHAAPLESLADYSLMDALRGRRSRRFGLGMAIPNGPFAYTSQRPPLRDARGATPVPIAQKGPGPRVCLPHLERTAAPYGRCHRQPNSQRRSNARQAHRCVSGRDRPATVAFPT